ncbi:MAG: hypothetical protein IPI49_17715 [Myxococcales bacterium]|nr:hypothetical protein [Myxococcales bacterium]HRC56184.1 hypothetical protein [Kofleriaceae bacterium]
MPKTLAEIAIDGGLVTKADAARAGRLAETRSQALIVVLVRELAVDEVALIAALHRQMRVTVLDPREIHVEPDALREVPKDACERLHILPLSVGTDPTGVRMLTVAMADPTDTSAIAELEQITGCEIEVTALLFSAVEEWVTKAYKGLTTAVMKAPQRSGNRLFVTSKLSTTAVHRMMESLPSLSSDGEISETVRIAVRGGSPGSDGDGELRLAALIRALVAKGLVTEEELEAQVQELLAARGGKPGGG